MFFFGRLVFQIIFGRLSFVRSKKRERGVLKIYFNPLLLKHVTQVDPKFSVNLYLRK